MWSTVGKLCGLTLMVCLVVSQKALAGQDSLETSFAKLDKFLAKQAKGEPSLEENLRLVEKWTRRGLLNIITGVERDSPAADAIKELARVAEDASLCSAAGYKLIKQGLVGTRGLQFAHALVKQIVVKSKQLCEPVFSAFSLANLDDGLSEAERETLLDFTRRLVIGTTSLRTFEEGDVFYDALTNKDDRAVNLYEYIDSNFRNRSERAEKELGRIMHEVTLLNDIEKPRHENYVNSYWKARDRRKPDEFTLGIWQNIVRPCSKLVAKLNEKKIFQLASVYLRVSGQNLRYVARAATGNNPWTLVQFYQEWSRYEMCKTYALGEDIHEIIRKTRRDTLRYLESNHVPDMHYMQPVAVEVPKAQDYDEVADEDL